MDEVILISIGTGGTIRRRRRGITPAVKPSKQHGNPPASSCQQVKPTKKRTSTKKRKRRAQDNDDLLAYPVDEELQQQQPPPSSIIPAENKEAPIPTLIVATSLGPLCISLDVDVHGLLDSQSQNTHMPLDHISGYEDMVLEEDFSLLSAVPPLDENQMSAEEKLLNVTATNASLERDIGQLRENQFLLERTIHKLTRERNAKEELSWHNIVMDSLSRANIFRQHSISVQS